MKVWANIGFGTEDNGTVGPTETYKSIFLSYLEAKKEDGSGGLVSYVTPTLINNLFNPIANTKVINVDDAIYTLMKMGTPTETKYIIGWVALTFTADVIKWTKDNASSPLALNNDTTQFGPRTTRADFSGLITSCLTGTGNTMLNLKYKYLYTNLTSFAVTK